MPEAPLSTSKVELDSGFPDRKQVGLGQDVFRQQGRDRPASGFPASSPIPSWSLSPREAVSGGGVVNMQIPWQSPIEAIFHFYSILK